MEKTKQILESSKRHGKKALIGVLALAAAGCGNYFTPKKTAERIAINQYEQAYKGSSPAGKYALQYLLQSRVGVHETGDGGGGVLDWVITINSGCLGGSSYNTNGGTIHASAEASGLFSVAKANVDAQLPVAGAYADWNGGNEITIHSGNNRAPVLHFTGVESSGPLKPADKQTVLKLRTYGCDQGIQSVKEWDVLDGGEGENISPWLHYSDGRHP